MHRYSVALVLSTQQLLNSAATKSLSIKMIEFPDDHHQINSNIQYSLSINLA